MNLAVIYIYPQLNETNANVFPKLGMKPTHDYLAARFFQSYNRFAPGADHTLHVMINGDLRDEAKEVLSKVESVTHPGDDSAWDISAYQRAAEEIPCDVMLFFGGSAYFDQHYWAVPVMRSFARYGEKNLYGACGTYEAHPHIRTTGFWCAPRLMNKYPRRIKHPSERLSFEYGPQSFTSFVAEHGETYAVNWDEIRPMPKWREPGAPNIYFRGDQSNVLFRDRVMDEFDCFIKQRQVLSAALADGHAHWIDGKMAWKK